MAATLPETGFVRLSQIVTIPEKRSESGKVTRPASIGVIPISKTSWWAGVRSGKYPAPVKLGPRTTAWRVEDIRALIDATQQVAA